MWWGVLPKTYTFSVDEWLAKLRQYLGSWPSDAASYFKATWGCSPTFAVKVATLYAALHFAGLKPRITSGFRDPVKQKAMRDAWDRGDREGLRVRPADPDGSRHCRTTMGGAPASAAIDMPCSNEQLAAQIAKALGLRAGLYFTPADPGHYDEG